MKDGPFPIDEWHEVTSFGDRERSHLRFVDFGPVVWMRLYRGGKPAGPWRLSHTVSR